MKQLLEDSDFILAEAAIVERLRRDSKIKLHDSLVHAPLIYDALASTSLKQVYKDYISIAKASNIPILICTPTWRANRDRVQNSTINSSVNIDAIRFMQEVRNEFHNAKHLIKIGGLIGCKNDCYLPEEGLSTAEAEEFHSWQIEQLSTTSPDFLFAATLPNVDEALGIAKAMQSSELPYIISFVIGRDGKVLDGSSLEKAIELIDTKTEVPPLGYFVNCSYPSFLNPENIGSAELKRLIGLQANASSLDHCDLDGASELHADSLSEWGELMLELNQQSGIKIMGGCCGTNNEHLQYMVDNR
ncbi:homocysteine S-methyltransferase family protein [Agarilytica rhodophyticola]|uniref:homocysteine S-methyltransferase family protein n=1 Tax=Agarilytica rhodophyticola TaxID=1737490 RepID=UPI00131A2CA3|nr:homocysteine S-methyltransferase family protein [Agarilytica rhodophyticola]